MTCILPPYLRNTALHTKKSTFHSALLQGVTFLQPFDLLSSCYLHHLWLGAPNDFVFEWMTPRSSVASGLPRWCHYSADQSYRGHVHSNGQAQGCLGIGSTLVAAWTRPEAIIWCRLESHVEVGCGIEGGSRRVGSW